MPDWTHINSRPVPPYHQRVYELLQMAELLICGAIADEWVTEVATGNLRTTWEEMKNIWLANLQIHNASADSLEMSDPR